MTDAPRGIDPFLSGCVVCGQPAIECCIWREGQHDGGMIRDYCADCIERGEDTDNFGRCYECRDYHDHRHCIGVPCQCPCPTPHLLKREATRNAILARLTPEERDVLGL